MCHRYRLFKDYFFVHTVDERVNISYHMEAVKFTISFSEIWMCLKFELAVTERVGDTSTGHKRVTAKG